MSNPNTCRDRRAWAVTRLRDKQGRNGLGKNRWSASCGRPDTTQTGTADVALCHADLSAGTVGDGARECMNRRGYAFVTKEQAEETRARFAATAAQGEVARPVAPQ